MSATQTLIAFGAIAYLLKYYEKPSIQKPGSELHYDKLADVRRWRHDGLQPLAEKRGNIKPVIPWEEVAAMYPNIS